MRIVLFINSTLGIPLMVKLEEQRCLRGVVITDYSHEANHSAETFAKHKNIPLIQVDKEGLLNNLSEWLKQLDPEMGLCLTFPYRLPEAVLDIPTFGIVNCHFGALPEYAGPAPLFWILKNREKTVAMTFHQMTDVMDSGPELVKVAVPILAGENQGLLGARLSQLVAAQVPKVIEKVKAREKVLFVSVSATPLKRPNLQDLTIDWQQQDSEQIEALVNACNSSYGGAITYLRESMIWILEVSPAEVPNTALLAPGSIVHSSQQNGLFVLCSDYRYLKLNILKTPECILTGTKLAALGIRSGEKLGLGLLSPNQNLSLDKQ